MENFEKFCEDFRQEFILLENAIEKKYYRNFEGNKKFGEMIKELRNKKEKIITYYYKELDYLRELRNIIVHEKIKDCNYIVAPHPYIIERIRHIRLDIENPPTAFKKYAITNVFTADINDEILEIMKVMKEKAFTHIPIYNEGKLVGIFSEYVLFNVILEQNEIISTNETFKTIEKYLNEYDEGIEQFEFLNINTDIFTVYELFEKAVNNHKRLTVFFTDNAKENGKILGIITAWDITEKEDDGVKLV